MIYDDDMLSYISATDYMEHGATDAHAQADYDLGLAEGLDRALAERNALEAEKRRIEAEVWATISVFGARELPCPLSA